MLVRRPEQKSVYSIYVWLGQAVFKMAQEWLCTTIFRGSNSVVLLIETTWAMCKIRLAINGSWLSRLVRTESDLLMIEILRQRSLNIRGKSNFAFF